MLDKTALEVSLVIFIATLVRSIFGFGEALVAVPLLALFIPVRVAAPLAVLVSVTIAAIIVIQDWREVHFRSVRWLVLSTMFGIPLGLALLTSAHQQAVKVALAMVIFVFAAYSLVGRRTPQLHADSRSWLLGCGFFAGILGGAYGMNGPPLVIYGAMRRWSAQHFRATLQGYFLPASLVGMIGYWLAGLWIPDVTRYYFFSLPAAIPAILLGRIVNRRLHSDVFLKIAYLGLAAIGAALFVQALHA